jgi:hypothetical protein
MFVLPGGAFGDVSVNDAPGFVFSSIELLKNYERAVESWGPQVPGSSDATFKLCVGGWPVSVYGVLHVYYSDNKKEISTQFRPVAYMLHASESEKSITKLLECAKAAVLLVSGVHVQHSTGCTDRAGEQRLAWQSVHPESVWVTCWPHVARKVTKEWLPRMHDKDFKDKAKEHLNLLHLARSDTQFNILAIVVAAEWVAAGEENLAAYVGKEYLTSPWNK